MLGTCCCAKYPATHYNLIDVSGQEFHTLTIVPVYRDFGIPTEVNDYGIQTGQWQLVTTAPRTEPLGYGERVVVFPKHENGSSVIEDIYIILKTHPSNQSYRVILVDGITQETKWDVSFDLEAEGILGRVLLQEDGIRFEYETNVFSEFITPYNYFIQYDHTIYIERDTGTLTDTSVEWNYRSDGGLKYETAYWEHKRLPPGDHIIYNPDNVVTWARKAPGDGYYSLNETTGLELYCGDVLLDTEAEDFEIVKHRIQWFQSQGGINYTLYLYQYETDVLIPPFNIPEELIDRRFYMDTFVKSLDPIADLDEHLDYVYGRYHYFTTHSKLYLATLEGPFAIEKEYDILNNGNSPVTSITNLENEFLFITDIYKYKRNYDFLWFDGIQLDVDPPVDLVIITTAFNSFLNYNRLPDGTLIDNGLWQGLIADEFVAPGFRVHDVIDGIVRNAPTITMYNGMLHPIDYFEDYEVENVTATREISRHTLAFHTDRLNVLHNTNHPSYPPQGFFG